ncbi:RHS repeat-associated core domain-containing protein [Treponema pedis]|nr:hypothetical protein [Treponema pedis]QSI04911.1 RHS repeat-associated core domain-containing protein [Treponema pedis]
MVDYKYKQLYIYLFRTAIERDSRALKSAVLHFVFFMIIINKMQQSAVQSCLNKRLLLNSPTDRTFENRRGKYKETGKKVPQAYRVYVEDTFLPCDAVIACIFSKEETGLYYYGARYLDPKCSRWLSGAPALNDYIPQAPIDDEAKKHNENLPGMGGIYNTVNLHVYHYAGNNPIKYIDPDGRETKQSGKGTIDEPFIQITVTNVETDAYKYTSTINYTTYMDNGKIFEQYSINSSFLIKDTEAGTKLANDMNVEIDMGYTLISSLLTAVIVKQIGSNNIAKSINAILAGIGSYIGSKYVFKYESGMKIETNTKLEVVSDSSGVKNSGNRTTNVYKREREDSDSKPVITCTENLDY